MTADRRQSNWTAETTCRCVRNGLAILWGHANGHHLDGMRDVFRHSPARPLTPAEHAIVTEWLAAAGDIASAYVSDRRSDDPVLAAVRFRG